MCAHFITIPKDELNEIIVEAQKNVERERHANAVSGMDAYPNPSCPSWFPRLATLMCK